MKALLGILALLLVGSLYGGYWLHQKDEAALRALGSVVAQKASLEVKTQELSSSLEKIRQESQEQLRKAQDNLKSLRDQDQQQIQALKASQDQLQKDFDAYKVKYRTDARTSAVGQKLEQLVTAKQTYTGVIIKGVDPTGLDIIHESGAAHVAFADLPDEWKDRLAYDPQEEAKFLADKEAARQESIRKNLMVVSPPKAAPGNQTQTLIAANLREKKTALVQRLNQIPNEQSRIQRQIDLIESKRAEWMSEHKYSKKSETMPDGLSTAAEQDLQQQISDMQDEAQRLQDQLARL